MYAVVETGGKQYRVTEGEEMKVEKLSGEPNEELSLDKVLLIGDGKDIKIGRPYLKGAACICRILSQEKDKKKRVYKHRRRKGSQTMKGHRQRLTRLKVERIQMKPAVLLRKNEAAG